LPAKKIMEALKTEQEERSRATIFVTRTFLYIGCAEVLKAPLIADTARHAVVASVLPSQLATCRHAMAAPRFREELVGALAQSLTDQSMPLASPFATIVAARCNGNRRMLATETQRLRNEFSDLRKRVRGLERAAFYGTFDKRVAARAEWENIMKEVIRNFGPRPGLLDLRGAISISQDIAEMAEKPTSPSAWVKAVAGLPIDALQRWIAQGPVIEIHRLRKQLPGPMRAEHYFERLFQG
jgi:hypothetical protein